MMGSALLQGLILASVAHANPPKDVELEANFLLDYVQESGCQFYRNGTWFEAKKAQMHLRDKYNYLVARNLINTTGDFIDLAATKSSLTGLTYKVNCNGVTIASNQWLRDELMRRRMETKPPR
jgi:hypothetical protein